MGSFVFPLLTLYLTEQRDFSKSNTGWVLGIGCIGLLLGNFFGGWTTDKWSRKGTLISGLFVNAIGFGLLVFEWPGWAHYSAFLFVGYFGSGLFNPAANSVIADLTDESQRQFAYTTQYISANLGMALGPLLGGFLYEIAYSLVFIGDVISSLACAFLIYVGVVETRFLAIQADDNQVEEAVSRPVSFQPGLAVLFTLTYFFLICPLMGLEFAVPLLVKEVFHRPAQYVGLIYTINAVCILALGLYFEKQARNKNECVAMIVSGVFWGTGLLILCIGYSLWALIICTFVWTVGEMIASIVVPTFISKRVAPATKGRYLSLIDIVRSLSQVICLVSLGYVWEYIGPFTVVVVVTTLPFIGIVAYGAIYYFGGSAVQNVPKLEMETES